VHRPVHTNRPLYTGFPQPVYGLVSVPVRAVTVGRCPTRPAVHDGGSPCRTIGCLARFCR